MLEIINLGLKLALVHGYCPYVICCLNYRGLQYFFGILSVERFKNIRVVEKLDLRTFVLACIYSVSSE